MNYNTGRRTFDTLLHVFLSSVTGYFMYKFMTIPVFINI